MKIKSQCCICHIDIFSKSSLMRKVYTYKGYIYIYIYNCKFTCWLQKKKKYEFTEFCIYKLNSLPYHLGLRYTYDHGYDERHKIGVYWIVKKKKRIALSVEKSAERQWSCSRSLQPGLCCHCSSKCNTELMGQILPFYCIPLTYSLIIFQDE